MKKIFILCFFTLFFGFCSNEDPEEEKVVDEIVMVSVGNHSLEMATYGEGSHTIIFESGLDATFQTKWQNSKIVNNLKEDYQVIIYNRAGYGNSERGFLPRTLIQSTNDLSELIKKKSINSKVIIVGHSWGGTVARAFAVRFPGKLEGVILLDPWHEDVFNVTQQFIDQYLLGNHEQGALDEMENALATVEYLRQMGDMPDIPTYILTAENAPDHSQHKVDVHASLGVSISSQNFNHELVATGHDIPVSDPDLVVEKIRELINDM